MKTYVTFGQAHTHSVNGKTFDKDCVAVVHGDREKVFEIFGPAFSFEYSEDTWDDKNMRYYPRGYITVDEAPEELSLSGCCAVCLNEIPDEALVIASPAGQEVCEFCIDALTYILAQARAEIEGIGLQGLMESADKNRSKLN